MKKLEDALKNDAAGRAIFRERLVAKIRASRGIVDLPEPRKDELVARISTLPRVQSGFDEPRTTRYQRKRALEKVAKTLRRAAQSIKLLNEEDMALLNDVDDQQILSCGQSVALLETMARNAERLAEHHAGPQLNIYRWIMFGLLGEALFELLAEFGIHCTTQKSFHSRPDAEALPVLDTFTTPFMVCAMLALLDSGAEKLDWSATIALYEAGKLPKEDKSELQGRMEASAPVRADFVKGWKRDMILSKFPNFYDEHWDLESEWSLANFPIFIPTDSPHYGAAVLNKERQLRDWQWLRQWLR